LVPDHKRILRGGYRCRDQASLWPFGNDMPRFTAAATPLLAARGNLA